MNTDSVISQSHTRDDVECMCCRFLMVQPTTLVCGHSFCRLCLVQWYHQSHKTTCMVCQKQWNTLPSVSITIRNMIENQYPDEYKSRCDDILTHENCQKISEFELRGQSDGLGFGARLNNFVGGGAAPQQQQNHLRNKYFLYGIIFTLCISFVWTVISYLFESGPKSLNTKPLVKWTNEEVLQWLTGLGPWAKDNLVEEFRNKSIDGALLIALSESEGDDLHSILTSLDDLHQNAFKIALNGLMDLGTKPPQDLWEYKSQHLFQVFCFVFITPNFPRLMLLQLYLFNYKDVFLPLVHRLCPVVDNIAEISIYNYQFEDLSGRQWIDFIWKLLFLPHFSVYMDFVWKHLWNTNIWISMYIIMDCLVLTYLHLLQCYAYYKNGWSFVKSELKLLFSQLLKTWFNIFIAWILWNWVPTFICNIAIYFLALSGPIQHISLCFPRQRHRQQ